MKSDLLPREQGGQVSLNKDYILPADKSPLKKSNTSALNDLKEKFKLKSEFKSVNKQKNYILQNEILNNSTPIKKRSSNDQITIVNNQYRHQSKQINDFVNEQGDVSTEDGHNPESIIDSTTINQNQRITQNEELKINNQNLNSVSNNFKEQMLEKLKAQLRDKILEKIELNAEIYKKEKCNVSKEEYDQLNNLINENNNKLQELDMENQTQDLFLDDYSKKYDQYLSQHNDILQENNRLENLLSERNRQSDYKINILAVKVELEKYYNINIKLDELDDLKEERDFKKHNLQQLNKQWTEILTEKQDAKDKNTTQYISKEKYDKVIKDYKNKL